jgi:hypothetical protein
MAERGALESRRPFRFCCDFGKRIVRMLVAIGRERRQRLELTRGGEPLTDRGAVPGAPRFDRPGDVRADEKGQLGCQKLTTSPSQGLQLPL